MLSLIHSLSNAYLSLTKRRIRVLCYHRINKYGDWFGVDTDIFRQHIKHLSENYNLISIRDFLKILNGEISAEKALLVTFDDGYLDNYTDAHPVLKEYSVPALMFLTTDFIDGKMWMWHDIYRFIVNNTPLKSARISINGTSFSFDFSSLKDRMNARRVIYNHCEDMPRTGRLNFLHRLANALEVRIPDKPTEEYAPLSWTKVRKLAKEGIDFGAHSCSHEILSKLNVSDCYNEIIKSKKRIEYVLRKTINAFSYPNGLRGDFNDDIKKMVRESGFSCAFTILRGLNSLNTDKTELMRFTLPNEFNSNLIAEVSGLNALKYRLANLCI